VALSVMGTFYALAGARAPRRLGWINFALSNLGVLVTIPALAAMLAGDKAVTPFVQAGTGLVMLGMVSFLAAILSLWAEPKRSRAAAAPLSEGLRQPAE
jgi:hypothetical protein